MRSRHRLWLPLTATLLPLTVVLSCSGDKLKSAPSAGTPSARTPVLAADERAYKALSEEAKAAGALDAQAARAAYPSSFATSLSYDPLQSEYLARIQASALALSDADKAVLATNGFVVSRTREFPTFLRGLSEIYSEHLPVYVSADALLEAVHSSYDTILLALEQRSVIPDVQALVTGMRTRLAALPSDIVGRADADLYLAVALSLLDGRLAAPLAGGDAALIASIVDSATKAAGQAKIDLFGVERLEDFSQFVPRGHYASDRVLQQYFRAMMWLGRVDLRFIETKPDGLQVFHRRQYEAMLLLRDLIGADLPRWQRVDTTIQTFVGPSDYMVVPEVDELLSDLGGATAARVASDEAIVAAMVAGGYGKQQIASHIMVNDGTLETLPLNRSFLIFGQRYIVDSHVFSEVVYDRLRERRMMPNPLDAAFAALGNNQALALNPDLTRYATLPGALARMRVLVDAHDEAFWGGNFYNLWMSSLRALSPNADATPAGLPQVAGTEAWGRRLLNTQLGSWSELRHDTLLYAKQSYTGVPACDFPDAYVDPYPAVFAAIRKYAEAGGRIVDIANAADPTFGANVATYFDSLRTAASHLEQMAELERKGQPFTQEQRAFINNAVRIEKESVGCASIDVPDGWYARLFFDAAKSIAFDPTIADVHTQPADEDGAPVGKVLHVGTGYPRFMVATVDSCGSPRAYAGVVYAYHEETTKNFARLTDEGWAARFRAGGARPADVPWMSPVLGPSGR